MSQFSSKFQSTPPKTQTRDADIKLRTSPADYSQENTDSAFARRRQETQKIKNLSFWENTDPEAAQEEEWTQRQSPTPFILVMVVLVVATTLLWFLYKWASGDSSNTPPIIAADTAPFKIRPENPGGMMIPHQDKLVYGRLSQNASQPIERLLPPPEQPLATNPMAAPQLQQPYPQGQNYNNPSQQGYAPNPSMQGNQFQPQLQQGTPQPQQSSPQFQQGSPQPQQGVPQIQQGAPQFQEGAIQPQQGAPYQPYQMQPPPQQPMLSQPPYSIPPQQQAPYGSAPTIPSGQPSHPVPLQAAENPSPPKNLSPVEAIKPAQDEDEGEDSIPQDGQNELDQLIAKEAEIPLKKPTKKNTGKHIKQMPIDASKHKVQIASLPSRTMAEQEMKRLQANHASAFGNKPWNIQKINLGPSRGYTYRLIVGSFANHNAASKFCKKLQGEKIGCMIIAPAG